MLTQNLVQGIRPAIRARSSSLSTHSPCVATTARRLSSSWGSWRKSQDADESIFELTPQERRLLKRMALFNKAMKDDPFKTLFGPSMNMLEGKGLKWPFDEATMEKWTKPWEVESELKDAATKTQGGAQKVTSNASETEGSFVQANGGKTASKFEYDPISGRMVLTQDKQTSYSAGRPTKSSLGQSFDIPVKPYKSSALGQNDHLVKAEAPKDASTSAEDPVAAGLADYDTKQGKRAESKADEDPVASALADYDARAKVEDAKNTVKESNPAVSDAPAAQDYQSFDQTLEAELSKFETPKSRAVPIGAAAVEEPYDGTLEAELSKYKPTNKEPAPVEEWLVVEKQPATSRSTDKFSSLKAIKDDVDYFRVQGQPTSSSAGVQKPIVDRKSYDRLQLERSFAKAHEEDHIERPAPRVLKPQPETYGSKPFLQSKSPKFSMLKNDPESDGLARMTAQAGVQDEPLGSREMDFQREMEASKERAVAQRAAFEQRSASERAEFEQMLGQDLAVAEARFKSASEAHERLQTSLDRHMASKGMPQGEPPMRPVGEDGYSLEPTGMQTSFAREQAACGAGERMTLEEEMRQMNHLPVNSPPAIDLAMQNRNASRQTRNIDGSTQNQADSLKRDMEGRIDDTIHEKLDSYEVKQGEECYQFIPDALEQELAGQVTVNTQAAQQSNSNEFDYALLSYNAKDDVLDTIKTRSPAARSGSEAVLSLPDVVYTLQHPEKFLSVISQLQAEGFEPVFASNATVMLRSASTKSPTAKTSELIQDDVDTTPHPTGYVSPGFSTLAGGLPHPGMPIRRTEPVFSGRAERKEDRRVAKRRFRQMAKTAGKVAVSGVAFAYVMGVLSELIKYR